MFVSEKMYPASFKGASFFYRTSDTSAGRKTVIHEFPQKDFRYVEDLGKNLRSLEINGIVFGVRYYEEKAALEKVLSEEGAGILVHPFYGNINVYPMGYTVTEDDTRQGVAHFTMRFDEVEENFSPRVTSNNTAFIANLYRNLYSEVSDAINLEYTLEFIDNIVDIVQVLDRIFTTLRALARIANSFSEGRNTFTKNIDNFDQDKYRIVQDTPSLAEDFSAIIGDFDNLTVDQSTRFSINRQAFGIGANDTFLDPVTGQIEERNKNRKLINGVFNYLILNNLFNTATLLEYGNDLELNNTQRILDEAYIELINNPNYFITNQLLAEIDKLRVQIKEFFDEQRLTVAKVATIKTQKIPATVLTYQLYGNTINYNEILSLNNITNPAVIEGDIRILEQ